LPSSGITTAQYLEIKSMLTASRDSGRNKA